MARSANRRLDSIRGSSALFLDKGCASSFPFFLGRLGSEEVASVAGNRFVP
jgi:hypothetical protein